MTMSAPLLPKVDAILVLDGDGNRLAGKYYGNFLKAPKSSSSSSSGQGGGGGSKTSNGKASATGKSGSSEDLKVQFEKQLHAKIAGIAARPDAAEVVTVQGHTAVFCGGTTLGGAVAVPTSGGMAQQAMNTVAPPAGGGGGGGGQAVGGDVRVVHVGPTTESELVLAHLCEGMFEALQHLMGGSTDRAMILDNLELVFLLIDEHCDGGIILEVDGHKLASAVLLRDEEAGQSDPHAPGGGGGQGGGGGGVAPGMGAGGMPSGDMTVRQALYQLGGNFLSGMTSRDGM